MQQIQSTYSSKWIESAAHPGPLLRFWKMDPSLLGALRAGAVTVRQFEVSSRVCSRFNPLTVSGLNLLHTQGLCCDSGRWMRCTWGGQHDGGDSSVQDELRRV